MQHSRHPDLALAVTDKTFLVTLLTIATVAFVSLLWLSFADNAGDTIDLDDGRRVVSICDSGSFQCPWFYVGDEVTITDKAVAVPADS